MKMKPLKNFKLYLLDSHIVLYLQRKIDKFFEFLIYLEWNRRRVYSFF